MPPRGRGSKTNINGKSSESKSPARKPLKPPVKKSTASKAHKLPPPLPPGEILTDVKKKPWRVGEGIGQGGFGLIYLASDDVTHAVGSDAEYVMKVEPIANGPLFCELHFYQRAAKAENIENFIKTRKLKYLAIPKFISNGQHTFNKQDYRFLVMQRFGTDLQKLFVQSGKRFQRKTVACLGLRMLDALEYMHSNEYVHADIKASNILLGSKRGSINSNEVYLVDFGLAYRYNVEGKQREYKPDPRKAHDGTVEFTSRDAHNGVLPSRRGDLEILGYCLLQWLCGTLPWEKNLSNKEYVKNSKTEYMSNVDSLMEACFPSEEKPGEICKYLKYVSKLDYHENPDYDHLRKILRDSFSQGRKNSEWTLDLSDKPSTSHISPPRRGAKRKSSENGLHTITSEKAKKKNTPVKQESMTPAMRERLQKIKSSSSTSEDVSSTTGRRVVKRSKAVKTDIAVQTSPGLRGKKR